MENLKDVRELSVTVKLCDRAIRNRCSARWCSRHGVPVMPHIRVGNRLRFIPAQVEAYLRNFQNAPSKNAQWWERRDASAK